MTRIAEFIEALNEEIAAVKSGRGGSAVKVTDGQFVRQQSGFFLYSFTLENFITAIDDAPVEVQVGGGRVTGQIIQTRGLEVVLSVERDLGATVPEARLLLNSYYLHEMLRKKFEAVQAGELSVNFKLAEQVFEGQSLPRLTAPAAAEPELGQMLNPSQQQAIDHSQSASLTYVWGPPGTGKTATLGRIVEASVKRGLRVLVAVHANAAVDEVTEDIAETLKATAFYQQGQILRLGTPQKESLTADYPWVQIETVVQHLGASLMAEQASLLQERPRIERQLALLVGAGEAAAQQQALEKRGMQLAASVAAGEQVRSRLYAELARKSHAAAEAEERLQKAERSGGIKRLFSGVSLPTLRQARDRAVFERDALRRQIDETHVRLEKEKRHQTEMQAQLAVARQSAALALRPLGITGVEMRGREASLKAESAKLSTRLEDVQKRLADLPRRVLADARVVCTTLAKTFAAKELPDDPFDVLIIDEASMAPMPSLYWALGRCRQIAVIAGDFLQLPPICVAETAMAQKWLGRSVYQLAGIETPEQASSHPAVCLLDTQYRMHPQIAELASGLFYGGLLRSHSSTETRPASAGLGHAPLTLLDTSGAAPWCSRLSGGGRFNLCHAVLAAQTAEKIVRESGHSVGIISPYAAQARLITRILRERGLEKAVRAATVHRFQGGEEDIILFDTVESLGVRVAPMLDDTREGSSARLLLNVALTRAKSQVILLANADYLAQQLSPKSALSHILAQFQKSGERIDGAGLMDSYLMRQRGEWAERAAASAPFPASSGSLHTERSFYAAFKADLLAASQEVILLSPFLSINRSAVLADLLYALSGRGVKVRLFTRPAAEQTGAMALHAEVVIEQMRTMGVEVVERPKMHQKAAILDRAVSWEGSLNILSHRDTGEQMRRFASAPVAEELIRVMDLDAAPARPQAAPSVEARAGEVRTAAPCSVCGRGQVVRVSAGAAVLVCTDGGCSAAKPIPPKSRVPVRTVCRACGVPLLVRHGRTGPFLGCSRYPDCRQTLPLR